MNRWKKALGLLSLILFLPWGIEAKSLDEESEPPVAMKAPQNQRALTLKECYDLALIQSETIGLQTELIEEARAHFLQAINGFMPTISYSYADRYQHGPGTSNFSLREIPEEKFVLSQPLFAGFKEFAAITAGRAQRRQREEELHRARQLLFTDVSDAFYLTLSYEEEKAALENIRSALETRIDELQKRVDLGRSRLSEVASAEARLRFVEADLQTLLSEEEIARQMLEFLTGKTVTALDDSPFQPEVVAESEYLAKANERPDVQAAREALTAAKKFIVVQRAEFFPTAALNGNYYIKRVGNAADVDWDLTINVDVPLVQGTGPWGNVKLARSQANQAELQWRKAQRTALLEIRNAYTRYTSALLRTKALEKAVTAAEKNLSLQSEDYQLNLVNNLEVLQALEDVQNQRREYVRSKNAMKQAYWNLQVATGMINP